MKDINKIGTKKRRKEMWVVKLKSEKQRKKVMRRKSNLKERRERIWENWTVLGRKMRRKMERIAREEDRRGRRVDKSYEKLKVKGIWWF